MARVERRSGEENSTSFPGRGLLQDAPLSSAEGVRGGGIVWSRFLWFTILLYLGLAVTYSLVTPAWEAPDEPAHVNYVRYLVLTGHLPVPARTTARPATDQYHQPPLYYLGGAALTFWVPTDAYEHISYNTAFSFGNDSGGKSIVRHQLAERFPYHNVYLAVHLLRLLSIALGVATLLAIYALGRELFPARPAVALGAVAITAFLPQFLFSMSMVNNDAVAVACSSWLLYYTLRLFTRRPSWRKVWPLGLWAGLVLLSKLDALILIPLAGLALGYWAWQRRSWSDFAKASSLAGGLALVVAGWWYLRNLLILGRIFGRSTYIDQYTGNTIKDYPTSRSYFLNEFIRPFYSSFVGQFGWMTIKMDEWVYWSFAALLVLAAAGLGLLLWRAARSGDRGALGPGLLFLGVALLALPVFVLLRWVTTGHRLYPQGRYLLVVIAAFALLTAAGLEALRSREPSLPSHPESATPPAGQRSGGFPDLAHLQPAAFARLPLVLIMLVLGMFFTAACTPFVYIAPAFAPPPVLTTLAPGAIQHPAQVNFGDELTLLGYTYSARPTAGGQLMVTAFWQARQPITKDYTIFLHLVTTQFHPVSSEDSRPTQGLYPTRLWQAGEIIVDRHTILIPRDTPTGGYTVQLGLYNGDPTKRLPVLDRTGKPTESIALALLKITGPPETTTPAHALQVDLNEPTGLSGQVQFRGYTLQPAQLHPGDPLRLTCYWHVHHPLAKNYTVFVHLLDRQGKVISQQDNQPKEGAYPTSLWESGEWIADPYALTIPGALAPGRYALEVGLYDAAAPAAPRLSTSQNHTPLPGNSIIIPLVLAA